ncbi:MAG: exodeoxyribonuclease VII small subunit [Bacteroidales bacterium]|nr:exodeoxyribonuclease VII small subunit [Bacteroidales bacterium]
MKKDTFSYDNAMAELETIVKKIESGECKIDELTAEVKKAAELIAACKNKLRGVEQEIDEAFNLFEE